VHQVGGVARVLRQGRVAVPVFLDEVMGIRFSV